MRAYVASRRLCFLHSSAKPFCFDEVLDAYLFESLEQVREYNIERPHDTLAGIPPATFWARVTAKSSPLELSP